MMIDAMTKLATEESNMARTRRRIYRHDDVGTFGGRLKAERKAKELYQNDMVEKLAQHGINISAAAYGKIETGETAAPKLEFMQTVASILDVDLCYLLTGREPGEERAWHEETEEAAELIDKMPASSRRLVVAFARLLLAQCQQQHEEDARIVMLLQDEIKALSPVGQTTARSYIDRRA